MMIIFFLIITPSIKNSGGAPAQWLAHLHFKDKEHEWAENAEWAFDPSHGWLQPGETATIKVGVLQDSGTIWRVTVGYSCVESRVERTLHDWLRPIPKLRRLLPNDNYHLAADTWHQGTNVTTARWRRTVPHHSSNSFSDRCN